MTIVPSVPRSDAALSAPADFSGRWISSFGSMTLRQHGTHVTGTYGREGTECLIEGAVTQGRLAFTYREPVERGSGWFRLRRPGVFAGEYHAEGSPRSRPWNGWRGCNGLWDTSIGRLRLMEDDGRLTGGTEHDETARLEADSGDGEHFRFTLEGAGIKGRGIIALDQQGYALAGEWVQNGQPPQPLLGRRVIPHPGLTWLVVMEAHWQRALDEKEYAFGRMLQELFARVPWAQVRHRFYADETSLVRWCRQLAYLPEPAVLVITGHGESSGLMVEGRPIAMPAVVDALRLADSLKLLHFSACLVGHDASQALKAAPFPVSGYTTVVDWAQSALTEFVYLDMILEKGLSPAKAAEQLLALVRFSGSDEIPGSPYRPAGFCFFEPHPEAIAPQSQTIAAAADMASPARAGRLDFRSLLGHLIGAQSQAKDRGRG
jgi:hypothetical protein